MSGNLRKISALSGLLPDEGLFELVRSADGLTTQFATSQGLLVDDVKSTTARFVPYSVENNLLQHNVVLFPSEPNEFGSPTDLAAEIKTFLHRYVDVSPLFEDVMTTYVMLTWLHDRFDELPYLRFRGDPGSGKTRCLMAIGSICYKPIFASGASTVSPVFRLLDTVRGTLILDEGDFRYSDEKAELIKILNNGNARGFPVLRSEVINRHEFDPRAYHVYGPKIIATRGYFSDHALETRCLTEELGSRRMRSDIPLSLPAAFAREALALRNKLLLYRFRESVGPPREAIGGTSLDGELMRLQPRMKQLLMPLLAIAATESIQETIRSFATRHQRELLAERGMDTEAQVIEVLTELSRTHEGKITIGEVTSLFTERHASDYDRKISPKWLGSIVRRRLGLKTYKSNGVFIIPVQEFVKLEHLREKYGIPGAAHTEEMRSQ